MAEAGAHVVVASRNLSEGEIFAAELRKRRRTDEHGLFDDCLYKGVWSGNGLRLIGRMCLTRLIVRWEKK